MKFNKLVRVTDSAESAIESRFGIDNFPGETRVAIIFGSAKVAAFSYFGKKDAYGDKVEFPGISLGVYKKDENGNIDPGSPETPLYRPGVFTVKEAEEILNKIVTEDFSAESLTGFIVTDDTPYN